MKVTDNRSGPTVVLKQDTRPGQVYGIGKVFYLKLEDGAFASLSTGAVVTFDAMANYLDVLDAEVVIK